MRVTPEEAAAARPGDQIVAPADVAMDRAFTVPGEPSRVWPWIVQLGKRRAGWYLPRGLERFLPPSRRATRSFNPAWQTLQVGDVIPDYGGRDETFEVVEVAPPRTLVYRSKRGRTLVTWSISLEPIGSQTRVCLRLRLTPVRHRWLASTVGGLFDAMTIAGMAAGLRERLIEESSAG